MDIIYIGSLFPRDREAEIVEKSGRNVQYAANNLQWSYIEGLSSFFPNMKILTIPTVASFGRGNNKLYFKGSSFKNHYSSVHSRGECIGFWTIPVIRQLNVAIKLWLKSRSFYKSRSNDSIEIIIYSLHTPFLFPLLVKKMRNVRITVIVPDLPEYMSDNVGYAYLLAKWLDRKVITSLLKNCDNFVLLSEYMRDKLSISGKRSVIIEGIYKTTPEVEVSKSDKIKTVVYTGAITKQYGIHTLIKAFKSIPNPEYRLILRGEGSALDRILSDISDDSRISWLEKLTSEELFRLQKSATCLILPKPVLSDSAKYFFPSKLIEYLGSGTVTITTRLPCIPREYFDYCIVADDDEKGISDAILRVCQMSSEELKERGKKGRQFIVNFKNPVVQVQQLAQIILNNSVHG